MRHADWVAALARGTCQPIVTLVAVEVQDAIEALQYLFRVLPGAAGSIGEDHAGRVIAAPSPVFPGQRPKVSGLCPAPARVQNWHRGFIHEQLTGALQVLGEPVDHRAKVEGGGANSIGERAAMEIDPGPGQDLALAV